MSELKKNKKMTIDGLAIMISENVKTTDKLAIMVAKGFESVDKRFDEVDKRFEKVDENIKDIKRDILNLGDRFVSYHTFDGLANRVKVLEEKKK